MNNIEENMTRKMQKNKKHSRRTNTIPALFSSLGQLDMKNILTYKEDCLERIQAVCRNKIYQT